MARKERVPSKNAAEAIGVVIVAGVAVWVWWAWPQGCGDKAKAAEAALLDSHTIARTWPAVDCSCARIEAYKPPIDAVACGPAPGGGGSELSAVYRILPSGTVVPANGSAINHLQGRVLYDRSDRTIPHERRGDGPADLVGKVRARLRGKG